MTVEQAKELLQTRMWEGLCKEVDNRIENTARRLRTCRPEHLGDLQKEIKAMEMLKQIPQEVIDRNEKVK